MKSLLFELAETIDPIDFDNGLIEYSKTLNLTVLSGTDKPAICEALLDTETLTKATGEEHDSDASMVNVKSMLETATLTLVKYEESDTDRNHQMLQNHVSTETMTRAIEASDPD